MKKLYLLLFSAVLFSCSNEIEDENINESTITDNIELTSTEESLSNFANILSKVVAKNKDVRVFLKEESLKEFDNNTDVLYYLISDQKIGDKTFREILVNASSEEEIAKIEETVPLLNIHNVRVAFLDVYPENMDVDDNEIPVAVSMPNGNYFYFNGEKKIAPKGEIPGFNLFFVSVNNRVEIPEIVATDNKINAKLACRSKNITKSVRFRCPEYDGMSDRGVKKQLVLNKDIFGDKAIKAYEYFYKDDGSINQIGLQRDYIYYGLTPTVTKGELNSNVSEYLTLLRINPAAYFNISDEREGLGTLDPYVGKKNDKDNSGTYSYTNKKSSLTLEEQLNKLWQYGAYTFVIEIYKSTQAYVDRKFVSLFPEEIWDMQIEYTKKEATLLKHSQHTYKIDAKKFKAKDICKNINLGKWDIQKEALERYITIYEEDSGDEIQYKEKCSFNKAIQKNFSGQNKVNIGLTWEKINVGDETQWSTVVDTKTTDQVDREITYIHKNNVDLLCDKCPIYYYDAIINGKKKSSLINIIYSMKTYNWGDVELGITAK